MWILVFALLPCVCVGLNYFTEGKKKLSTASRIEHQNRNKTTINQDLSGETFKEKRSSGSGGG